MCWADFRCTYVCLVLSVLEFMTRYMPWLVVMVLMHNEFRSSLEIVVIVRRD